MCCRCFCVLGRKQIRDHVIDHFIEKSAEGTYYTLAFPVPEGLSRLDVAYSYERKGRKGRGRNVIDIGLSDHEGRFVGWSGSARNAVFVGPHAATRGYLRTELKAGEWGIIVGAYRVPPEGLAVRYVVSYEPAAPGWLDGDLHVHSDASDGRFDIYKLAILAQRRGLSFIAVANHNNCTDNFSPPRLSGLSILPAVEWTHYKGHLNIFGLAAAFEDSFVANEAAQMRALLAQARERGALVSVNHPHCPICPYLWEDTDVFDMVEVWNGPMRPANVRAMAWWHGLLAGGRRVALVGGSDFHRPFSPVRLGRPVTRVFADSPSAADILAALGGGHAYVTASKRGVELRLGCGAAMMGDVVEMGAQGGAGVLTLEIEARRLKAGMRLKLVTAEGAVREWRRFHRGVLAVEVAVEPEWWFAYLVVYRKLFGMEYVRAICNPVYFEQPLRREQSPRSTDH